MIDTCNYPWETKFSHIIHSDSGCPKCGGTLKHNYEYVQYVLAEKRIGLKSKVYINSDTPLDLFCLDNKCKYEWSAKFSDIQRSSTVSCPKCYGHVKLTYEEVKIYLCSINIELLTEEKEYANTGSSLQLKCDIEYCHNKWHTTFDNIKYGKTRCPKCYDVRRGDNLRFSNEYVKLYLSERNITLLSEYINSDSIVNLQCNVIECKYVWKTSFSTLKYYDTGCPKCAGTLRHTYDFVKNFLVIKDIELLEKFYINIKQILRLQCKNKKCNMPWECSFRSLYYQDTECPFCHKYKNENLTRKYLSELLPNVKIVSQYKINTPDLKVRKNIFVDYFFEVNNKKYIIEYNGGQHYTYTKYFHKSLDGFSRQQMRDEWLERYCAKYNIKLIVIDGRKYRNEQIMDYLKISLKEIKYEETKD